MSKQLSLIVMEKLSQLIYRRRDVYLRKWFVENKIDNYEIYETVRDNDRCAIFHKDGTVYCVIAGSDDTRDWIENAMAVPLLMTIWTLFWGYLGYARPAREITQHIKAYCVKHGLDVNTVLFMIIGHSRGDAIAQNVFGQVNTKKKRGKFKNLFGFGKDRTDGHGFGGPNGGGTVFRSKCNSDRYHRYQVEGDPVPNANPFPGGIGVIHKLPRYVTGKIKNRLEMRKQGEMNHHGYHQVADVAPFKDW